MAICIHCPEPYCWRLLSFDDNLAGLAMRCTGGCGKAITVPEHNRVACTGCKKPLKVRATITEKHIRCPHCNTRLFVEIPNKPRLATMAVDWQGTLVGHLEPRSWDFAWWDHGGCADVYGLWVPEGPKAGAFVAELGRALYSDSFVEVVVDGCTPGTMYYPPQEVVPDVRLAVRLRGSR